MAALFILLFLKILFTPIAPTAEDIAQAEYQRDQCIEFWKETKEIIEPGYLEVNGVKQSGSRWVNTSNATVTLNTLIIHSPTRTYYWEGKKVEVPIKCWNYKPKS